MRIFDAVCITRKSQFFFDYDFYVTGRCISTEILLRRTLHRSVILFIKKDYLHIRTFAYPHINNLYIHKA
jgi:hypothetical protein